LGTHHARVGNGGRWPFRGHPAGQQLGESPGSPPGVVNTEVRDQAVNEVGWDVVVVLVIILVGGFFSGAEMALVSLREGQVRQLEPRGKRGQRAARLASDPNRFLSAVQIGVTVATLLSGAFGAATLATALKSTLIRHHVSTGLASVLSLITVTVVISF